jgi:hypothetical protein
MILFSVLGLCGAHVLGRQIASEFPGARAVPLRAALRQYAHSIGERAGRVTGAMTGHDGGAMPSRAAEIERLLALRERGVLSADEFETAKHDVLAGH